MSTAVLEYQASCREEQSDFSQRRESARPGDVITWRNSKRGSGKTWALLNQVHRLCSGDNKTDGILVGNRYLWESVERQLVIIPGVKYRQMIRTLTFPNGSMVRINFRERWPECDSGGKYDWIGIDRGGGEYPNDAEISGAQGMLNHGPIQLVMVVG